MISSVSSVSTEIAGIKLLTTPTTDNNKDRTVPMPVASFSTQTTSVVNDSGQQLALLALLALSNKDKEEDDQMTSAQKMALIGIALGAYQNTIQTTVNFYNSSFII